ncbi:site-specific DNA-methyltransferase [Gemella sp. zg-570]|uniref:site-specific DNA-methyltransferase n=2 Tax=unclassified Gemella TaxID=2624949 RepID=UPI001C0DB58F|nr:site-specific DNA-methyltransferase [Gemella sp. zg-570]QWQ38636.1 site-specific DNA-methyltransferase [Gemella sp. zg-570]
MNCIKNSSGTDPPYNTGNKDFIYNDSFVDKTDGYSHSKWLSFMEQRLEIARELLSDEGVIFISIDDNEQAQLKLLCDEVFGEENYVGHFIWVRKKKGSFLNKKIRKMTEYVLCYTSNERIKFFGEDAYSNKMQPIVKRTNSLKMLKFSKYTIKTKLKDGEYKKGKYTSGNTGVEFLNDFIVKDSIVISELLVNGRFVWTQDFLDNELNQGTFVELSSKFGFNVLRHNQDEKFKTPSSLINSDNGVGTNEDASDELSKLLNLELEDVFNYSKPTSLIKYLISFIKKEFINATILDFFAGFYVIIMLVVKSLIKSRVLVILQNIKTQVSNNLCVV